MTTIDINKTYRTRDGRRVYFLVDTPNLEIIHGPVEARGGSLVEMAWNTQGRFNAPFPHKDSNLDLIAISD